MRNPFLNKAISAYATANSAVPPLVAVVRLYERAMVHLHAARDAAAQGRFEAHHEAVNRAVMIFAGLDSILIFDKYEDVAQTLRRFYHRLIVQAGSAASRRDPVAACDSLIRQLSFMLKAWQAIAAERGVASTVAGASAKGPHASVVGRTMDHAHGGLSA
ncbi:flagellar export chaperone FliS [Azospirillum doebereinerae]|uniref:Flagellar protein FliS n=1 Tax=Azospirillum doebereinerae TaxID=92933 RepID=A0A433J3N3_9PROT|nr:flagellar export chaperone FliS [Azospirillum doebereinerae]MCG5244041.1 flagellar protein FliS [Azospirillum doebereinerae]RUQ66520.1 flagellar protein FliS [Azospirillum doebereinerae]